MSTLSGVRRIGNIFQATRGALLAALATNFPLVTHVWALRHCSTSNLGISGICKRMKIPNSVSSCSDCLANPLEYLIIWLSLLNLLAVLLKLNGKTNTRNMQLVIAIQCLLSGSIKDELLQIAFRYGKVMRMPLVEFFHLNGVHLGIHFDKMQ
ncbi:hypothetical protein CEXT_157491 [Caerostris extrusa]|uniref:Uncharacterized protein n=1 Tax=Caerostris extrusa TaxID=172846 RepID=A0AAV4VSX6_CAEEX|nr:hypothetical protein CEXT_157491 [Caerostris extrusa]